MHFHYRVTFTGYIRCFRATTSHVLVTLTFELLTLRVSRVQCFSCPSHIPIFIILQPSVTELQVLSGVNPTGDRGDTSPQKNVGWGTVMHHVPKIWRIFRCIVTECGSFLNSAQCFGIIVSVAASS